MKRNCNFPFPTLGIGSWPNEFFMKYFGDSICCLGGLLTGWLAGKYVGLLVGMCHEPCEANIFCRNANTTKLGYVMSYVPFEVCLCCCGIYYIQ